MYDLFSEIYDSFMDDIPYKRWFTLFKKLAKKKSGKCLELGCGTGNMTAFLCEKYDVLATDVSESMLEKAKAKGLNAEIRLMDMRKIDVKEKFDIVVSLCDCMNYMKSRAELKRVFKGAKRALADKGVFIFDMKTDGFFRYALDDQTFFEERDGAVLSWKNEYNESRMRNHYVLDFFVEKRDGLYERFHEEQDQYAYPLDEVKALLLECGFENVYVVDEISECPGDEHCDRVYFVCR